MRVQRSSAVIIGAVYKAGDEGGGGGRPTAVDEQQEKADCDNDHHDTAAIANLAISVISA